MKSKSVNVNIDTGGKVRVFNDNPPQEANWRRKEKEMTERAARFYPSVKEAALERELFNQVQGRLKRERDLSQTLFNQVAAHDRSSP